MSFQDPKVGPGPQPVRAHFVHMTPLGGVGKNGQKYFGPPINQTLDLPLNPELLANLDQHIGNYCADPKFPKSGSQVPNV